MAWVTNDGEYNGSSLVIEFDLNDLTNEQWERVEEMADSDRYEYVKSILEEDDTNVRILENMNFGREWGL